MCNCTEIHPWRDQLPCSRPPCRWPIQGPLTPETRGSSRRLRHLLGKGRPGIDALRTCLHAPFV